MADTTTYLEPVDDGLLMRPAGPWADAKLDYLARYITVFETSMRQRWEVRHYIDLFAGPGKNRIRDTGRVLLGSPLIALTTEHPFTGYYFVDISSDDIRALDQRCRASPYYDRVEIRDGDSNVEVDAIVAAIKTLDAERYRSHRWTSLNLAFLDPQGLELQWETVAKLASVSRMDLIINYPQCGLNRYMRRAYETGGWTSVDSFFGGREWRDIYRDYLTRPHLGVHRRLLDLYKGKLQDLGYAQVLRDDETGDEPLMRNAARLAPMYRLLFASKHPLGHKFWSAITRRDVSGQLRLL